MKWIMSRLTMKPSDKVGFTDKVDGSYVRYWMDKYSQEFLAVNKFGFRVKL